MAIQVTYDAKITVNSLDVSDWCQKVTVNDAQETKPVRVMGTAYELARPGYSTPTFEATFYNDHTSGTIEPKFRGLVGIAESSAGFAVSILWHEGAVIGPSNPTYNMTAILDGDVNLMDDEAGEQAMMSIAFKPFSSFTVSTTTC
jgi:hypothetical protein